MEQEVNEKDEKVKSTVTIPDVPELVHKKIRRYRRKINLDRNTDFTLMEAYTEFLIEATENMPE